MGAGFSLDAINVVRSNRSLVKKRKFKDLKSLIIERSGKTELQFKKVSPEELFAIKSKIRKEAEKAAEREITIYGICILMIVLLVGFFVLF